MIDTKEYVALQQDCERLRAENQRLNKSLARYRAQYGELPETDKGEEIGAQSAEEIKSGESRVIALSSDSAIVTNQSPSEEKIKLFRSLFRGREDIYAKRWRLTEDEHCYFLAMDFDGSSWEDDVVAVRAICKKHEMPFLVERSRSGLGGHVWFFFAEKVRAVLARKFGTLLLNGAMVAHRHYGVDACAAQYVYLLFGCLRFVCKRHAA